MGLRSGPWHEPITQPLVYWERGRGDPRLSEPGIVLSILVSGRQQAPPRPANPRLRRPAQHLARCSPAHTNVRHRTADTNIQGIAENPPGQRCPAAARSPCCLWCSAGERAPAAAPAPCPGRAGGLQSSRRGGGAGSSWIPSGAAKFLGFSGSGRRGRGESVSGSRSKQGPGCGAGSGRASAVPRLPERAGAAPGQAPSPPATAQEPPQDLGTRERLLSGLPRQQTRH